MSQKKFVFSTAVNTAKNTTGPITTRLYSITISTTNTSGVTEREFAAIAQIALKNYGRSAMQKRQT